jgi:hypothetical protein
MNPKVPFAEGKRASEFGRALLQKLVRRVAELQEEFIPPENVANMPHGHGWRFQQQRQDGFAPESGEFEKHSSEVSIHDDRILSNDRGLVEELIFSLAEKMHNEFMKGLMREVDETCTRLDRVTNVAKGASLADGILSSLEPVMNFLNN